MNKLLLRAQPYLEPMIAVAFLVTWALAETGRHQIFPGSLRSVLPWWGALLAVCLAIAFARIQPIVAMALSCAVVLTQLLFPTAEFTTADADWPIYFGFLVVLFGVSASVRDRWRTVSFVFAAGLAVAVAGLLIGKARLDWSGPLPGDGTDVGTIVGDRVLIFVIALMLSLSAWFLGFSARVWQHKARTDARLAEATAELHRAEVDLVISRERDRIAQDVHDIMAHSLAVIIAQADGARFVASDRPEAVSESLSNIADSARASLTDVRMLIETLVAEPIGHSTPTLANLNELVERIGSAGLQVRVDTFGDPAPLTTAQELAVYRVVQESLTNALKHAGNDATARVTLDWRGPGLAIAVSSQGTTRVGQADAKPDGPTGGGRGLYGMRERARLAGGWLTAGPDDEPNAYIVTAFIPATLAAATS
jgi:signal transduction histidine kinase